jgi:hypothetical protein
MADNKATHYQPIGKGEPPEGLKKKIEKMKKKGKSGGDPHGRTTKEKVKDFAKGVGLTSGQKKAREFAKGGLLLASGVAGNLASRAANIVKKAHAHKKE